MAIKDLHKLIEGIMSVLFAGEQRRHQKWIDQIAQKNKDALNDTLALGFIHNGRYFRPSDVRGPVTVKKGLVLSLQPEGDALIADMKLAEDERGFIRQTLVNLMQPCRSEQELRDALPECIVECIPQLRSISRTRDPAWTIQGDERAHRQYLKMLPKLEEYSASRLVS